MAWAFYYSNPAFNLDRAGSYRRTCSITDCDQEMDRLLFKKSSIARYTNTHLPQKSLEYDKGQTACKWLLRKILQVSEPNICNFVFAGIN